MAATAFRGFYRVCVFRLRKLFINEQEEGMANETKVEGHEEKGRRNVDASTQTGMEENMQLETELVQLEVGSLTEEMPASETNKNSCLGKYRSEEKNEKEEEEEKEEEGKEDKEEEQEEEEEERQDERKDRDTEVKSSYHSQIYSRQLAEDVKPEYTWPASSKTSIAPFVQESNEYDFIMSRLYDPAFVMDPDFELLRLDVFEPIRVSQILPQMEAEEKHWYFTKK